MTIEESVVKQINFVRQCFEEYRTEALGCAEAKSDFENDEAVAGNRLINDTATNESGELITLTNDTMRKAFIKDHSLAKLRVFNIAKEKRDLSSKKVDIEISVLSALKQLANDEHFDQEILGKYDI